VPNPSPKVTNPVTYCQNAQAIPLTATGDSLQWYTTETGATGSRTAPTPSTANAGTTNYYVSHIKYGCESSRTMITVIVKPSPVVNVNDLTIYLNTNGTLTANATGVSYLWQDGETTQSISVRSAGKYCVTVTDPKNSCESSACGNVRVILPGTFIISGTLTYDNTQNTAISNTTAYLENTQGMKLDSTATDNTGAYKFVNVTKGSYNIVCGKTAMKCGGSNPVDALTVNRFYVGMIKTFGGNNTLRNTAADVNNDGYINPIDALAINRRFIGILKKFNIPDWLFESPSIDVSYTSVARNIKAICAGDVNGSYPK
jgi:hypothetical protein